MSGRCAGGRLWLVVHVRSIGEERPRVLKPTTSGCVTRHGRVASATGTLKSGCLPVAACQFVLPITTMALPGMGTTSTRTCAACAPRAAARAPRGGAHFCRPRDGLLHGGRQRGAPEFGAWACMTHCPTRRQPVRQTEPVKPPKPTTARVRRRGRGDGRRNPLQLGNVGERREQLPPARRREAVILVAAPEARRPPVALCYEFGGSARRAGQTSRDA